MGINSQAYLSNDVRASDVVEVIAHLCGATRKKEYFQNSKGYYAACNPDEVSVNPKNKARLVYVIQTHDMQYFEIVIAPTTCDGEWHTGSLFLYPDHKRPNRICVYGGVSDFWKKIDRALVDFFGGEVDDNDCDSSDVDYKKRKPRKSNCPSDGKEWQDYQDDLLNLPQLFKFK